MKVQEIVRAAKQLASIETEPSEELWSKIKAGLKKKPNTGHRGKPIKIQEIIALIEAGKSQADLCRELGVSGSAVYMRLKRAGYDYQTLLSKRLTTLPKPSDEDLEAEQWKVIKDFEMYEVSSLGRVRRRLPGMTGSTAGQMLRTDINRNGYVHLCLHKNGKQSNKMMHRLVAEAFVPNPLGLPQVNHKDTVKSNNRATNLEWRSALGNQRHALKLGITKGSDGLFFDKRHNRWSAHYSPEPYISKYIGSFSTKVEALAARKAAIDSLPDIL